MGRNDCVTQHAHFNLQDFDGNTRQSVSRSKGTQNDGWIPLARNCLIVCLLVHWVPTEGNALAPPPHLRACPGPLDQGDASVCGISGNVSFAASEQQVLLSAGSAFLRVVRDGGFSGTGTVQYAVANVSALAGIDFASSSDTLSWTASDAQAKVIEIPLINSGSYTAGRYSTTFRVFLQNPSQLRLGAISNAEITILNSNAITGTIDMAVSEVNVDESDGALTLSVTRTGGSDCNASVSYRTVTVPGFDFGHYGLNTQTGEVMWGDGDSGTKTIRIPITDDAIARPSPGEKFYVEIMNAGCAPIGSSTTLVTVFDNDEVGFVQLDTPAVEVFSDGGTAYVTVSRIGGSTSPISVDYYTVDGTATAGSHFSSASGQLVWGHGDIATKTIAIGILSNAPDAGSVLERTFELYLAYVTGTTLVNNQFRATVTIYDVLAQFGKIGFQIQYDCRGSAVPASGNCYYFREDEDVATLVVTRTGGLSGQVSVDYVASNVTVSAFNDFQNVSGTLTWPDLDMDPRYVTIPIRRDDERRPIVEFMVVQLSNPRPLDSVLDAARSTAYVGAIDQDGAGSISISTVTSEVMETDGVAYFGFNRSGVGIGSVVAYYETVPGTAEEGTDFVRTSGNVTWADVDMAQKVVAVSLVNDYNYRFGLLFKEFSVRIVGASNNTFVDPREETATVTVVDDNVQTGFVLFSRLDFDALAGTLSGSAEYSVLEGTATVTLTVKRQAGIQGSLRVRYRTEDGTAASGVHYEATSGALVWLEGDDTTRAVTVTVIDDSRFSPRLAFTAFRVRIYSVEVFSGARTADAYAGPANVTATVTIEEDDGPGLVGFAATTAHVREEDAAVDLTVSRTGGAEFAVSVNFSTQSGTAWARVGEGEAGGMPTACANTSSSGIQMLQTARGVREVYCDLSEARPSASMLVWDKSTLLWNRECAVAGSGGAGGAALWTDLNARLLPSNSSVTAGDASSWADGLGVRSGQNLTQRPGDAGAHARPVPFPLNDKVVWFDWENRRLLFESNATAGAEINASNCVNVSCCANCTGGSCLSACNCSCNATSDAVQGAKVVTFAELGITGAGGMDDAANDFYFITDGISSVHVGTRQRTGGASGGDGVLIDFNWTTEEVASSSVAALSLAVGEWCTPTNDAFGHLLWTVNGRVLYRDCSASQPASGLGVVLGGPMSSPSSQTESITMTPCPSEFFDDCGGWDVDTADVTTGLDLFAGIDSDGYLHLGVWAAGSGLFSCGGGGYFATVRTGIELAREVKDDFVPVVGGLSWSAGDRSNRTITVPLLTDGQVDSALEESFQVHLFSSVGATLLDEVKTATVMIEDQDGPGRVEVTADNETFAERGLCCYNCANDIPDRNKRWCAGVKLTRSSSRGPLCVDVQSSDVNVSSTGFVAATAGVHYKSKNTTVCWAHKDEATKSESVTLLFHPTYDTLFKTVDVAISAAADRNSLPALAVSGSSFLRPDGADANTGTSLVIEDADADVGLFSLVPDTLTGFAVYGFDIGASSAIMSVGRFGGSDVDVLLQYSTESVLVDANDQSTESEAPIPVTIVDGSRGTNVFCLSDDVTVVGPCADSSSSTACDAEVGQCTAVIDVAATQAVALPSYNATVSADFRSVSGTIQWAQGDRNARGISIPLFHPEQNSSGAIYRVFKVVLSSPTLSLGGRPSSFSDLSLPSSNPLGACSPMACLAPEEGDVIGQCNTHTCRDAATSEGWVVMEVQRGAGNLRLVNTSYFVPEGMPTGAVALTVQRVGGTTGNVSVQYRTTPVAVDGIAVAALPGEEFGNLTGVLLWMDGDSAEQVIEVPIPDDDSYRRGRLKRSFAVEIANATGGAQLRSSESQRVVVVVDDDVQPGVVQVLETKKTVLEGSGIAVVEVARIGGVDMDIFVKYHTGFSTVFSSVDAQTGNSSAHSAYLSAQAYACQTTIASVASASIFTTRRGGGDAGRAFDNDNSTFWDSDIQFGSKWLKYTFSACGLGGVAVSSYTFVTAPSGVEDGCPAAWELQGSQDGIVWTTVDTRTEQTCSSNGREYTLDAELVGFYDEYRWVFSEDSLGFTGVRVFEVLVTFGEGTDAESSLVGAMMCNNAGECCVFQPGECDIGSGHTYPILEDASHDFVYSQGLLFWPEGDNSTRNVTIQIIDDCLACSNGGCAEVSQLQDKPLETFTLTLNLASDVEIRTVQGDNHSVFPFRTDVQLHDSFFYSVITIQDDDGPGVLSLWTASCGLRGGVDVPAFTTIVGETESGNIGSCAVLETARVVSFLVTRQGSARGAIAVGFKVEAIDAIPGVDFEAVNGTLRWSHGDDAPKSFEVQILRTDGYDTGRYARRIQARLEGTTRADGQIGTEGGAEIRQCSREVSGTCVDPARQEMVVTILDVDAVPGAVVVDRAGLSADVQYPVDQDDGSVTISVMRTGGDDLPLVVQYATVEESGQARACANLSSSDCEFDPVQGNLSWADGDTSSRSITISVRSGTMRKAFETFILRVWGDVKDSIEFCAGFGVVYQSGEDVAVAEQDLFCTAAMSSQVTVTIRESGSAGYIQLDSYDWPPVVSDADGFIVLAVDRVKGEEGIVSVQYGTQGYSEGGFAIANTHFIDVTDTISWSNGDTNAKTISVSVLSGSVPTNSIVDLTIKLTAASAESDIRGEQSSVRVVIQSSSFTQSLPTKTVGESSSVQGELNTISVGLESNSIIGPGGQITISGLTGSLTADNGALAVSGSASNIVGGSGSWVQSTGTLTLTIAAGSTFEYDNVYTIEFVLQNPLSSQGSAIIPTVAASGTPGCARTEAAGLPLSCPGSIAIAASAMTGAVLEAQLQSFVGPTVQSRLCLYDECPHSPLQGARNFITISFSSPLLLAASSTITVSGLTGTSTPSGMLSGIMNGVTASFSSEQRQSSLPCVCTTPLCACEVEFEEIPPVADVTLRVQIQCNSIGWGSLGGDSVYIRVGTGGTLTEAGGDLTMPPQSCEDSCETAHDLLSPAADVASFVSSTGRLFVAIQATSHVDFCGLGEYVRANVTVTWQTETTDLVAVNGTFDQEAGTMAVTLPALYSITASDPISLTFPVNNPVSDNPSQSISLSGLEAGATEIGTTAVNGSVLFTSGAAEIKFASITESNRIQGKLNHLTIRVETGAVLGGLAQGVWVTFDGLLGAAIESDTESAVAIRQCDGCMLSASKTLSMAAFAGDPRYAASGTAMWDAAAGRLRVLLRGHGPTYLVDRGALLGVVTLRNSAEKLTGVQALRVSVSGDFVQGTAAVAEQPLHSGGVHQMQPILRANLTTRELSGGRFQVSDAAAYTSPGLIRLSVQIEDGMQPSDQMTWRLPGLTTCVRLFDNETACTDISPRYLTAPNGSDIAGAARNALVARWDESERQLRVEVQAGRAVCPGSTALVEVTGEDHSCTQYACGLKVLPYVTELERGAAWVSSDGLDCGADTNPFCDAAEQTDISRVKVYQYPGAFWGQPNGAALDAYENGTAAGRAWFGVATHNEQLFVVGGIGADGFAHDVRVSSDGSSFTNLSNIADTLGVRGWFPMVTHAEFLWVLGGRRDVQNSSMQDVWRSATGEEWCEVTAVASWGARHRHAALSFQNQMWVLGGQANAGVDLSDVWRSDDGGTWAVATRSAAFGGRAGHAAATHAGRMWVYGGDTAGADVWASTDGVTWMTSTTSAGWSPRNLDVGLVFDGRMWVVGGYNASQGMRDVWWSADGADWTRSTAMAQWGVRYGARSVAFRNRMWVLGGAGDSTCFQSGVAACFAVQSVSECDGVFIRCGRGDVWLDSFGKITFTALNVQTSSNVFSAENGIQIKAVLDVELVPGSVIVVSGLSSVATAPEGLILSGPSAIAFGGLAIFDDTSGNASLTVETVIPAGSKISLTLHVRNSASHADNSALHLSVQSASDKFAITRGSAWTWLVATEVGDMHTVVAEPATPSHRIWDGGAMFDVVAKRSLLVDAFRFSIPEQTAGKLETVVVEVFYKSGAHSQGMHNLSEWRSLGSVTVSTATSDVSVAISDLRSSESSDAVGREGSCVAQNFKCDDTCTSIECECDDDAESTKAFSGFTDARSFQYDPYTFCVNETYCSYDNHFDGACECSAADVFDCVAAEQGQFAWLGPQPTWTENTAAFMSSSLGRHANITGVLAQSESGFWHSGNGSAFGHESGCVHLPTCDETWPYNVNQWLSFDLGTEHTLSAFRTLYPNFTDIPDYFYLGQQRTNIDEEDWSNGQYKDFEMQTSARGLDGPWVSVLRETASQAAEGVWQSFSFEPVTARYWRLKLKNNYGFGYVALKAIEFYGTNSVWATQSKWCYNSVLCNIAASNPVSISWDSNGAIRDRGLQLSAGTHGFYIRTNIGVQVQASDDRLGDVHTDDGRLAVKVGSVFEGRVPHFGWESGGEASAVMTAVEPQRVSVEVMNAHEGFVVVSRFLMSSAAVGGTLFSIGEDTQSAISVKVVNGTVHVVQGSTVVVLANLNASLLASDAEYCFSAQFANDRIRAVIRGLFSDTQPSIQAWNETFLLATLADVNKVVVGAKDVCGAETFDGTVLAMSIYGGQLDDAVLDGACRRSCSARQPDGSCYHHLRVVEQERIETAAASDIDVMMLPPPPHCVKHVRLRVTASSTRQNWCVAELVLFHETGPTWSVATTRNTTTASQSDDGQNVATFAFDGDSKPEDGTGRGGGQFYCSVANETSGWLSVEFPSEVCITGYAMLSLGNGTEGQHGQPSTWALQGSDDGITWRLLNHQAGVTWQQQEWQRFELDVSVPYMFVTNLFDSTTEYGYNTMSRLYRWIGEDDGWQVEQEIPTRGARSATHFETDGVHYLAISQTKDSTLIASARDDDGRVSDSQVGSDIFRWTRDGFVPSDSLSTNISLSMTHFSMGGDDYLVSADHRRVVPSHGGADEWASILFKKVRSVRKCDTDVCPIDSQCGCHSCQCGVLIGGGAMSGGASVNSNPGLAFDGDDSTMWQSNFTLMRVSPAAAANSSSNISTNASISALEYHMRQCVRGASILGYSIQASAYHCPSTWILQAGSDGSSWFELDRQTGQSCNGGAVKTFLLEQPSALFQRFRWVFIPPIVNGSYVFETSVEIKEVELMFSGQDNRATLEQRGSTRSFDFSQIAPPFKSVGRDSNGFPVSSFRTTEYDFVGSYGTFDLALTMGTGLVQNCSVGGHASHASLWSDPLAPFGSCAAFSDLCDPAEYPICFGNGTSQGQCAAGNDTGSACDADADCHGGYCARGRRYAYRLQFKQNTRLVLVRVRGCGWCGGRFRVRDSNNLVVAEKDLSMQTDCDSCLEFRLAVLRTGTVFFLEEENNAPFSLRSSISFDFETASDWMEEQLLPTSHAQDFEYFAIANESYLAVANFRDHTPCYGSISCFNARGSIGLVPDTTLPYNIDSFLYKYNGSSFQLFQAISSRGAVDWEHFMLSGRHYLCIANSFDAEYSSSSTTSVIYAWNGSAFAEWQHLQTHGAKACKYYQHSGRHLLFIANSYDGQATSLMSDAYVWDGSKFAFVGAIPSVGAATLTPFKISNALYIAVANRFDGTRFALNSTIQRVHDAVRFKGAIVYSDAFLPSASFVVRTISSASVVRDVQNNITVALQPDRDLPPGCSITITGLVGTQTPTGSVPLTGQHIGAFANQQATFDADTSSMLLVTSEVLSSTQPSIFGFAFTNGLQTQAAVQARIQTSGSASISAMVMDGSILEVSQVDDVAFTHVRVTESSAVLGAYANTLTLSFRPNSDIHIGSFVALAGLVNSPTATSVLELSGAGASFFASVGEWQQDSGTLNLTVSTQIDAFATVELKFSLANPASAQAAVFPALSSAGTSGFSNLPTKLSDTPVFGVGVGPSFVVKEVADSTTVAGIGNTIFLTLQPSTSLWEDTSIIIGNLVGSSTLDGVIALSGPHNNLFKDQRASFSAEGRTLTLTVGPNCVTECESGDCLASSGTACVFPFLFQGVEYLSCTALGSPDSSREWCGTQSSVASPVDNTTSGWGFCDCSATIPDDSTTIVTVDLNNPLSQFAGATPTIQAEGFTIPSAAMTGAQGASGPLILAATRNLSALVLGAGESAESKSGLPLTLLSELTIELWIQRTQGSNHSLLSVGDHIQLLATSGGFALAMNGSSPRDAHLPTTLDGSWQHVAVTWTSSSGRVGWYINGQLERDQNGDLAYLNTTVAASGNVTVGASDSLFEASVSMVRVWSVARNSPSSPSILELYKKVLMPSQLPSALIVHYAFDTGASEAGYDSSQSGMHLVVRSSGGPRIAPILRTTLELDAFTYPGFTLDSLTAFSVGAEAGGDVCISVSWQTSQDLGAGAVVNVTNLFGLQTAAPVLPLASNGQLFGIVPYALWDRAAGQLTLELQGPVRATSVISFNVTLIAALSGSEARQLQVLIQDGSVLSFGDEFSTVGPTTARGSVLSIANASSQSCNTSSASIPYWSVSSSNISCPAMGACVLSSEPPCACTNACPTGAFRQPSLLVFNGGSLAAASNAWVTTMHIGDSTSIGAASNVMTVTLQPDRDIPSGSRVVISGLTGSRTGDRTAGQACAISGACFLSVSGASSDIFESFAGSWEQTAGRLTLVLSAVMESEAASVFSFTLQNSVLNQTAVTPTVEVTGPVWIPLAAMCGSVMDVSYTARRLLVKSVLESTCVACKSNLVTVSLQPSVDLIVGDNISITNLTQTLTPSGKIQLSGPDSFRFKDGLASFVQPTGTLDLEIGVPVAAEQMVRVSFLLHNGQDMQNPRVPRIRMTTAGHDVARHGTIEWEQADGFASFSYGGVANSSVDTNSSGSDLPRWMATGWATQSTIQTSNRVWLEKPSGSCCVGSCCPAATCCSCSSLASSGMEGFGSSGVYFEGSPCEVVCDMATSGGGWTLASVHTAGGNRWGVYPNTSDPQDLQHLYGTDNMWEDPQVVFGDWRSNEDVRTWAFSSNAGDSRGAGEQVMVTVTAAGRGVGAWADADGAGGTVLLQTEGSCVGHVPLSVYFSSLAWNCSSADQVLSSTNRSGASTDAPVAPDDTCAHACVIAASNLANETALVGASSRRFLFFKAGANHTTPANQTNKVYLSTDLRAVVAQGTGLGVACSAAIEECGQNVAGADSVAGLRYAVWVRRLERWQEACDAPYYRQGSTCECCWCPAGHGHNGGKCEACPAGKFKSEAGTGPCEECWGALEEGRATCGVIEVWISTRSNASAGIDLPVSVSVQFQETGSWSEYLEMFPPSGQAAGSTSRLRTTELSFVGTPRAVRYTIPSRENEALWWPQDIAVRSNDGLWHMTNSTLCPVDANCRHDSGCAAGRHGYGVLTDGAALVNCTLIFRTSEPEMLYPLPDTV